MNMDIDRVVQILQNTNATTVTPVQLETLQTEITQMRAFINAPRKHWLIEQCGAHKGEIVRETTMGVIDAWDLNKQMNSLQWVEIVE